MPVGMLRILRLSGQSEGHQRHNVRRCIGQIVHSICTDGHTAADGSNHQLSGKQQHIAEDPHNARQCTILSSDLRILRIPAAANEQPHQ